MLPKTAGAAQTHKSMNFIWIVWSTLYVYLCPRLKTKQENKSKLLISGLQIHDTCNSEELTQKHLYHIISTTREAASVLRLKTPTGPPLLGMIGIGEPATLTETTGALHAFNIPLISVTPHPTGPSYSNVLTTAPDMAGQARVRTLNSIISAQPMQHIKENFSM